MIIFDSNFVLTLLRQIEFGPEDKTTGKPLEFHMERVQGYFEALDAKKDVIGIPTPVIAELGIRGTTTVQELVSQLSKSARFRFLPFDAMAAIECASIARAALEAGQKRAGAADPKEVWAKLKFDRQILAIAIVNRATAVCTWDSNLMKLCKDHKISTISIFDLQVPEAARQHQFDYENQPDAEHDNLPE